MLYTLAVVLPLICTILLPIINLAITGVVAYMKLSLSYGLGQCIIIIGLVVIIPFTVVVIYIFVVSLVKLPCLPVLVIKMEHDLECTKSIISCEISH